MAEDTKRSPMVERNLNRTSTKFAIGITGKQNAISTRSSDVRGDVHEPVARRGSRSVGGIGVLGTPRLQDSNALEDTPMRAPHRRFSESTPEMLFTSQILYLAMCFYCLHFKNSVFILV